MQRRIINLFFKTAYAYPWRASGVLANSALTVAVSSFAGPYIISILLSRLQSGHISFDGSWPLLVGYALTQLYGEVIGWRINLYLVWTFETAAQRDLLQRIFQTLTTQSMNFHANRFGGSLVSQTTKLTGSFERFWDTLVFQLVPVATSIVAAIGILSFVFWQYALFLLVASGAFIALVMVTSRTMAIRNRRESQANTAVNGYLADVVTNILAVKAHGAEQQELDAISEHITTWRGRSLETMRSFLLVSTGYSSLIAVLNITAIAASIWASEHHAISIAVVYLSITYTFTVATKLWDMNSIMRNYNRVMGDAHDMTEILSLDIEVDDHAATSLVASKGAIDFRDVTFAHDGDKKPLFDNFSLHIKPGEKIGLVGHSGSGKTTLTRLLLRFMDISSGEIAIDDQSISQVTQASLRRTIAYVPQEPMLFHRSLQENIAYGKPGATMDEIVDAATKANAMEFIRDLPHGFDTLVGERGVKLSGGQRQRIAIARAILKNAPILVLDEATSALDSESEVLIQDALWKLMEGRTAIVVAHRLSTIQHMDRIVVMDHGHITEQGSHRSLLQKKGAYAKLWAHQSGGFIEE